jgi:abortive infection bacteriophage resistance protein
VAEYTNKWLPVDEQATKLQSRGVEVRDPESCRGLLLAVGYDRRSGYLYPFRESEPYADDVGRTRFRILNRYRAGTVEHTAALIEFD